MGGFRIGLLAFVIVGSATLGDADAAEYSADILQTGPKGESSQGRLFVSDNKVRTEMQRDGKSVIQIADGTKEAVWILLPAEKSYIAQPGRFPGLADGARATGNPCDGLPGAQCKELGSEQVSGRDAVRWEVSLSHQGQTVTAQQWIDSEYKIPLRQQLPNNQIIETQLTGRDKVDGREVEKVEVSLLQDGKVVRQSKQWFDVKLRLVVRQEFPGGGLSEVKNIKEGPQDASLFRLPEGYKEMKMPANAPNAGAPAR